MAQILLLCLILANAYVGRSSSEPYSNPQAPSTYMVRKLGKHEKLEVTESYSAPTPRPTKERESHMKEAATPLSRETAFDHETVLEPTTEHNIGIEVQNLHPITHRHSIDKSVAGGGVILGGLATTFLVAVFCYIRATGRNKNDNVTSVPGPPTTTSSTPSSRATV